MKQPHNSPNQPGYDSVTPGPEAAGNPSGRGKWYRPTLESKILVILVIVASLLVLGAFAARLFARSVSPSDLVKPGQYQAVFLSNGQVYFGKITGVNGQLMVLEDIYYLQVDQQLQPDQAEAGAQQPAVSLAKLGNELHAPEDQMFISVDEVVFWENLKNDGQVAEAIVEFQQTGQTPTPELPAPAEAGDSEETEAPGDEDTEGTDPGAESQP